ncbi:monovalent cation/H(+) antiporter subunit G [Parvularcula lutaonensis]|uniref:Monovalent cation/H(+) antiporter subunit G n=1 Tax=Parvularcula lutaonensis TaxID=491923 RepID=A0ABV7MGQ2_9PROT|nr:monovalent cation/H(+) antiporter subunit G [Parvularcula lutaonensis]GGY54796.1 sodium:proton antiporter [Parvularcula lutaonensis]
MELLLDILSWPLLLAGGALVILGAVGVLRFPDFYTRTHAAGVTDTFGADLILLGLLLQVPDTMTGIKLVLIFLFMMMTSPVATHSIAHAAYAGREAPLTGKLLLRQNVPVDITADGEIKEAAE